jgi:hypothetical protein
VALASIDGDVKDLTKNLGLTPELKLLDLAWQAEMGRLSEGARIVALDKTALVVEVDSHAVMQELSLRRRELVRKINGHLPAPLIERLTVRMSQYHGR